MSRVELIVVVGLIAILSLLIVIAATRTRHHRPSQPFYEELSNGQQATVSLVIDFGNGVTHQVDGVRWIEDMTVERLLEEGAWTSPGFKYESKGSGEMTMLTSLDGVANGEGNGRYWLYSINDQPGEVSFAVQPLAGGDRVLWKFSEPE